MEPNKDDKDDNDIQKIIDLMEKAQTDEKSKKVVTISFGFLLHPNKYIHLLLSFVINLLVSIAVYGYFDFANYALIENTSYGYILLTVVFFTGLEYLLKVFIIRFFPKLMLYSLGLIFFVLYFFVYILLDAVFGDNYSFVNIERMIVFVTAFSIIRMLFSTYLRKFIARNIIRRMKVKK